MFIGNGNHCKAILFIDVDVDAETVSNAPLDISPYGTLKNMKPQVLPVGYAFPATNKRRFNEKWLNDYIWLEYSISNDAAFCYPCRQFSPIHERDNVFKFTGFSHWKSALESNKGFKKHQKCGMHLESMAKWAEAVDRQKNNTSVFEMASGNVLQFRRNYVKKVIEACIVLHYYTLTFSTHNIF